MNVNYGASNRALIETLGSKSFKEMIQFESQVISFKPINLRARKPSFKLFIASSTSACMIGIATDPKLAWKNTMTSQKEFFIRVSASMKSHQISQREIMVSPA